MDSCCDDILTRIGDFLPWQDRLHFERLSSRFRNLPCQAVKDEPFSLSLIIDEECFFFEVLMRKESKPLFLRIFIGDDCLKYRKATDINLVSASKCFDFAISVLRRLMSIFSFQEYFIKPLGRAVLSILPDVFNKKYQSPIPGKLVISLSTKDISQLDYQHQRESELSAEEWAFLENLKGAYSFSLFGPTELKAKEIERFAKLPWLHTVKNLELLLGLKMFDPSRCIPCGEFLQKLVDQKAEEFECFLFPYFTPEGVLRYLKSCLAGSHALRRLNFDITEHLSESDLLSLGFQVETDGELLKATKIVNCREKKEGRNPDRILLEQFLRMVTIEADYDEYKK